MLSRKLAKSFRHRSLLPPLRTGIVGPFLSGLSEVTPSPQPQWPQSRGTDKVTDKARAWKRVLEITVELAHRSLTGQRNEVPDSVLLPLMLGYTWLHLGLIFPLLQGS